MYVKSSYYPIITAFQLSDERAKTNFLLVYEIDIAF